MKMPADLFAELKAAILATDLPLATERQRWDALWASKFSVTRLYAADLNDNHIDTALRRIAKAS